MEFIFLKTIFHFPCDMTIIFSVFLGHTHLLQETRFSNTRRTKTSSTGMMNAQLIFEKTHMYMII